VSLKNTRIECVIVNVNRCFNTSSCATTVLYVHNKNENSASFDCERAAGCEGRSLRNGWVRIHHSVSNVHLHVSVPCLGHVSTGRGARFFI